MSEIKIPSYWEELAEDVHQLKGVVMVVGASDTGKTTLAIYLAGELLKRRNRVSIVSADMGQCAFGPPAAISMAIPELIPEFPKNLPVHSMYFVGSTSPVDHLLQTVVGVKKLVDRSLQAGAEVVIVDTTGFVSGGAAWELKFHKIELTDAGCIVALQRGRELEDILIPHERRTGRRLYRLPVSEDTKVRSYEQRREYRRQRYQDYFRGAKDKSLPLSDIRLINPYDKALQGGESDAFKRLLVGLNDDENFSTALGVIEDIDLTKGTIRLITPLEALSKVRLIRLGSIKIEEDWGDSNVGPLHTA
ncbi:MAG: Clp1/GlmU family protein [Candidatus Brocadiales bacterium]